MHHMRGHSLAHTNLTHSCARSEMIIRIRFLFGAIYTIVQGGVRVVEIRTWLLEGKDSGTHSSSSSQSSVALDGASTGTSGSGGRCRCRERASEDGGSNGGWGSGDRVGWRWLHGHILACTVGDYLGQAQQKERGQIACGYLQWFSVISFFLVRFVGLTAYLPWKVLMRATLEAAVSAPPVGMQLHTTSYDWQTFALKLDLHFQSAWRFTPQTVSAAFRQLALKALHQRVAGGSVVWAETEARRARVAARMMEEEVFMMWAGWKEGVKMVWEKKIRMCVGRTRQGIYGQHTLGLLCSALLPLFPGFSMDQTLVAHRHRLCLSLLWAGVVDGEKTCTEPHKSVEPSEWRL